MLLKHRGASAACPQARRVPLSLPCLPARPLPLLPRNPNCAVNAPSAGDPRPASSGPLRRGHFLSRPQPTLRPSPPGPNSQLAPMAGGTAAAPRDPAPPGATPPDANPSPRECVWRRPGSKQGGGERATLVSSLGRGKGDPRGPVLGAPGAVPGGRVDLGPRPGGGRGGGGGDPGPGPGGGRGTHCLGSCRAGAPRRWKAPSTKTPFLPRHRR